MKLFLDVLSVAIQDLSQTLRQNSESEMVSKVNKYSSLQNSETCMMLGTRLRE